MHEILIFQNCDEAEMAELMYYLSVKWELYDTVDSDGDGT